MLVDFNYPVVSHNFVRDCPVENVVVDVPVNIQGGKQAVHVGPGGRECAANPPKGKAILFEFACHPQSKIGTVAENLGIVIHRLSLDVCD